MNGKIQKEQIEKIDLLLSTTYSSTESSFKLMGDFALRGLSSLLLLNGGAALTGLPFLTSLIEKKLEITAYVLSLKLFAVGAGAAVIAMALSYMAQFYYTGVASHSHERYWYVMLSVVGEENSQYWNNLAEETKKKIEKQSKIGNKCRWLAIFSTVVSIVLFLYGVCSFGKIVVASSSM